MIDINEINDEIKRLEHSDTTYCNIEKLAALYEVREHLGEDAKPVAMSYMAEEPKAMEMDGTSSMHTEIADMLRNAPREGLIKVMEEHLEAVRTVFPKEYDLVVGKIRNLTA